MSEKIEPGDECRRGSFMPAGKFKLSFENEDIAMETEYETAEENMYRLGATFLKARMGFLIDGIYGYDQEKSATEKDSMCRFLEVLLNEPDRDFTPYVDKMTDQESEIGRWLVQDFARLMGFGKETEKGR